MKKFLWISVAVVVVIGIFVLFFYRSNRSSILGGSYITRGQTVIGSSTNLKSLPRIFSFTNNTTTDTSLPDGGSTIVQSFKTEGVEKVRLNISAVGGTATSTLYFRPQFSYDDSNWFNIYYSTSTPALYGISTTTLSSVGYYSFDWDPRLVTTTASILIDTYGSTYTRFLFYGEDVTTDPNDGVQAFIQILLNDASSGR